MSRLPLAHAGNRGYRSGLMQKMPLLLAVTLLLSSHDLLARGGGGGGFHGGGDFGGGEFRGDGEFRDDAVNDDAFRQDVPRVDTDVDPALRDNDANIERNGDDSYRINADGDSATVRGNGDGVANVNVRTVNGVDYDAAVVGPDGFRNGYVWRNGEYVSVNCDPWVPYVVPFGSWAGWSIVTQPDFVQYPVYSTYPVETAVEVALQKLGLYSGPIDGLASSCAGAIEQYQMQNGMPVTGTITPELLAALGIQASFSQ